MNPIPYSPLLFHTVTEGFFFFFLKEEQVENKSHSPLSSPLSHSQRGSLKEKKTSREWMPFPTLVSSLTLLQGDFIYFFKKNQPRMNPIPHSPLLVDTVIERF